MGKLFGRVNYIILFGRSVLKVAVYTKEIMKFVRLSVCFVIKVPPSKKSQQGKQVTQACWCPYSDTPYRPPAITFWIAETKMYF